MKPLQQIYKTYTKPWSFGNSVVRYCDCQKCTGKYYLLFLLTFIFPLTTGAQTIMLEIGNQSLYSNGRGSNHALSVLFDISNRWSIGPQISTANDLVYDDYAFIRGPGPVILDPIHTAYRVQNGRTLYPSERFYRGTHAMGLAKYLSYSTNFFQSIGLGLAVNYTFLQKGRWNMYGRIVPAIQRVRIEFEQSARPFALAKMNENDPWTEVLYSEKQVYFYYDFSLLISVGGSFSVIKNLDLGIDLGFYSIDLVAPSLTLFYSFSN